ncbi:MAG: winged helix-turn-helix domain-containing protein, partial [Desulfurococcaceae archaeon]
MTIEDLSKTERTIYFYLIEQGKPLSVRDIARALSMPPSTVHYNLRKLESRKLVVKTIEGYIA